MWLNDALGKWELPVIVNSKKKKSELFVKMQFKKIKFQNM